MSTYCLLVVAALIVFISVDLDHICTNRLCGETLGAGHNFRHYFVPTRVHIMISVAHFVGC